MFLSHKSLSTKNISRWARDQQERGARDPELTAGDSAGDLRLKAKANVLNGGVKDQEKKGARRQAGGQKSDDSKSNGQFVE